MNELTNVTANDIKDMTIAQLKCVAAANNIELGKLTKKQDILDKISETLFAPVAAPDNSENKAANDGAGTDNNKNGGSENEAGNSANDTDKKDNPADKKNDKPKSADGWAVARVLKVTKPLMKGDDVKALQAALIAHNYHCGIEGASGTYEKNTAYAVRCFQSFRGLVVDGKAGRYTVAALGGTWTA